MDILAIIPARGGSKGLPGKNIAPLAGRPLLAWTCAAAGESHHLTRTILSTDDPAIAAAAIPPCEVPFLRPADLATDSATVTDVILQALDQPGIKADFIVLLQPTSPLRTGQDIDACIELCIKYNVPSCVSVTETKPIEWCLRIGPDNQLEPVAGFAEYGRRRQDNPPVVLPNGAVYVARVPWFRETRTFFAPGCVGYIMPPERSIDIDVQADLIFAEALLSKR